MNNPFLGPFPGLRPFEFEESHLFFGRDGLSERMIAKLAATRFLAVVGTSGSGKSSLVRAGLLPALHSGFMPGAGAAWRIAITRPGNDPLGNLARALHTPSAFGASSEMQAAITEATLRRGRLGLVDAAREQQLAATENLLVVVDQFEELFRVDPGAKDLAHENDSAAFVKLLLAARAQRDLNVYIVLTMRSDYLGDCSKFWDLPEAINDGQYLVPRLTREQIREAITGPLFVGGAEATPRLINRLLNDVGDDPDQLPILQHALMRTYAHWIGVPPSLGVPPSGGSDEDSTPDRLKAELRTAAPIDLPHYEAIGGMNDALSLHADEAFHELPDERHRVVAERVFKALTEKGPDNREIRRPDTLGSLCKIANATEAEVKAVIQVFRAPGRSFLMPPNDVELKSDSLIDISHESLMRNWQRLKAWVESEARSARIYRRLAETAALYAENKAGLWRDPDLQIALDWREADKPNKEWATRYFEGYENAIAFLEKSRAQRQADLEAAEKQQRDEAERAKRDLAAAQALADEQQRRAEEQTRAARRLRWLSAVMIGLALLAGIAAWVAFTSYRSAEAQRANADRQRQFAQQNESLANDAKNYADKAARESERQKQTAETKQREAEALKLAGELQRRLVARQNEQLTESGQKLSNSLFRSDSLLYVARGLLALAAFDQRDYGRANDFMEASFPVPGAGTDHDLRSFDWFYLWRQLHDEKQTLKGHADGVLSVSFSPDGQTLASGSDDNTVKLWDVVSGQGKGTLSGHEGSVYSVAISPDGRTLASGSNDMTVKLWDIASGQEKRTLRGHQSSVSSVTFSPDGRTLASGSDDNMVMLWDMVSGQKKGTLRGHQLSVSSVTFSPDGRTLASGSDDTTVKLWDVASGQEKETLRGHTDRVSSVKFSPDGRTLASGSLDKTVKLWDVASGKERETLKGHAYRVSSVTFSPDGRTLASGSLDNTVKLWDVGRGQEKGTLKGHADNVSSVTFSPDGRMLASGSLDNTVKLWGVASDQKQRTLIGHAAGVYSVTFSPDGRTLASGSLDNKVKLWDVASGQEKRTLIGHSAGVFSVTFSPDGRTLASGSLDRTVKLWDVASGQEKGTLSGHQSSVSAVTFSPDGRTLASGSMDKTVKLWDVASGQEKRTLPGHESSVLSVTFSLDGRTLASGSDDKTVKLWDVGSGKENVTLVSHESSVSSVTFSPDGRTLASGSLDNAVKLWDVVSGQEKATLKGHADSVYSVTFSPDGRTLASGGGGWAGSDGKMMFPILLWSGATDAEVARDCIRCGRKE